MYLWINIYLYHYYLKIAGESCEQIPFTVSYTMNQKSANASTLSRYLSLIW